MRSFSGRYQSDRSESSIMGRESGGYEDCEEDESFECIHVQYAWTLPKVQEMYANNVRDGKVKDKSEGGETEKSLEA